MRPGGRRQQLRLRKQYRPMKMEVLLWGAPPEEPAAEAVRVKSPRTMASAMMTVLPPSMMCCVPIKLALRDTLLPVS